MNGSHGYTGHAPSNLTDQSPPCVCVRMRACVPTHLPHPFIKNCNSNHILAERVPPQEGKIGKEL